ncbi:sensor histidine kinase [Chloroflexus sp.]|uniref:sensor histidine kinase n=1 Tax=Chloroflexus sp. TaxID=1904827 RepID=UPI002614D023|nr:HAMP domain-containing sensor histidine kinase [uncultured Chloroflexus sp.]
MSDDDNRSVTGLPPDLYQLSPLTVTERELCCALVNRLPTPAWLIIGPTVWPVTGGAAQPTPCCPLPFRRAHVADVPALAGLFGTQSVWFPLSARGLVVGGLVLPVVELALPSALLDHLTLLVEAIYSRRMATRQALWQHLLSQIKERYAAGEDREALLTEVLGSFFRLVLQPASGASVTGASVRIPGIDGVYRRDWPFWFDEAHAVELALAITDPAITQIRALRMATAGVAHDINNLLTVILGRAQLLELDAVGQQVADLQMIATAAEVGADTARRLQRYTQLEQLHVQPVDLVAIAHNAIAATTSELSSQNDLMVIAELDPLPSAPGDAALLRIAVTGLIIAAARASPNGGLIRVGGGSDEQYVWIEIADPALPPNTDLRKVSAQTRRAHSIELAIARQVARVHRGHLRISSAPSGGTLIQLLIPRA